jgi:hypothetical protein
VSNFSQFFASDSGMSYPVSFECDVCETELAPYYEAISLKEMLKLAQEHLKVCDHTLYYVECLLPDGEWEREEFPRNLRTLKMTEGYYQKYKPDKVYRVIKVED